MKPPRKTAKPRPASGEPRPQLSPETVTAHTAYARAALHGTAEELAETGRAYRAHAAEDARKHAERAKEQQAQTADPAPTPEHPEEERRAA